MFVCGVCMFVGVWGRGILFSRCCMSIRWSFSDVLVLAGVSNKHCILTFLLVFISGLIQTKDFSVK